MPSLPRLTSEPNAGAVGSLTIPPLNGWTAPLPTPENLERAARGEFGRTYITMAQVDEHPPSRHCDCPDCRTYWETE